jgi:hypothetical protein
MLAVPTIWLIWQIEAVSALSHEMFAEPPRRASLQKKALSIPDDGRWLWLRQPAFALTPPESPGFAAMATSRQFA